MRVTDVLAAVAKRKAGRVVLCGRRDAALVAILAAAVEPAITHVAVEELLLSFESLFGASGYPINAASILPGLWKSFGDVAEVLAAVAPRKVLVAAGVGELPRRLPSVQLVARRFSQEPSGFTDWLAG
jgi:hypothetical protein